MTTATYRVLMKSGRKFLVEELASNNMPLNSTTTGTIHPKKALVKEMIDVSEKQASIYKESKFKNSCVIAFANRAIEYINTLDALGLERINSEAVRYLDC